MRTISIVKYIFTLIGLGMLIGAFFLFTNTRDFVKNATTAKGSVIELFRSKSDDSFTYRPVVEFTTHGGAIIRFTSSAGSNPPSFSRGEIVEVLYQSDTPEQAKINSFFSLWGVSAIFGGLGLLFLLIGVSFTLHEYFKRRKIKYLKINGTSITTVFQSVEVNGSYKVNGRNPYQICTQWKNPATSEIHLFNSENIWFDPTEHIKSDAIIVLIDKNNPKKYHVDISFLPRIAS